MRPDFDFVKGAPRPALIAGLALVAGTVLGGAASGPFRPTGTPVRASMRVEPATAGSSRAACQDGWSGSSWNDDRDELTLQHGLGGGRRLCAQVLGAVRFDEKTGAIRELPPGSSVVIETREREGRSQRMRVTPAAGEPVYEWRLNGAEAPVDDAARAWLKDALEVTAGLRAIGSIQGQVGSLQGQIGTIQGEIGSLQGEIGRVQGEEGSLQGRIGTIQGERGGLQGQIGAQQGAIGALQGRRWQASEPEQQRIDREIEVHERKIRELEAEMERRGFSRRLDAAEDELRAFRASSRAEVGELEKKIAAIRAEDRIGQLEKEIEELHADDRIDEIKRRLDPVLERLKGRMRALAG